MIQNFSLLGGPFHRLACRTGLVRHGTNTTAFGLTLGVALWIGLLAVAFAVGTASELFSLSRISGHVRLLIVIPLLFLAESLVDPRVTAFAHTLSRAGIVPDAERPAFHSTMARIVGWKDSWVADALCLVVAVVVSLNAPHLLIAGVTAGAGPSQFLSAATVVQWYWIACLTLFRFLLARWIWRLVLWAYFLLRISRLDLHLVPTHPDGAAGLGSLEIVHTHFLPLVLALSAVQSASLVEELSAGTMTLDGIVPAIAVVIIIDLVLFVAPLFIFFAPLWTCRLDGLRDYMAFGAEYVSDFDRKWVRRRTGEPLLGTPDLQSLADLNNSLTVVRNQRLIPASSRLFVVLANAAVAPMLPLLLFKYPLGELAARFFMRLTGF